MNIFTIDYIVYQLLWRIPFGFIPKLTPEEIIAEGISDEDTNQPPLLMTLRRREKIALRRVLGKDTINQNDWNNFDWNDVAKKQKLYVYKQEKPTWDELVEAHYAILLESDETDEHTIYERERVNTRTREALADDTVLYEEDGVYVGKGLSHMTGLAHLVESANIAGSSIFPILMRSDEEIKTLFTQREIRSILLSLAERENMIESAHNVVMQKHYKLMSVSEDETLTAKERYKARHKAYEMVSRHADGLNLNGDRVDITDRNYEANLKAEIANYDPDVLPEDVDELRQVYIERLESVATKKIAKMKNAATQHGIDLPESCVDQTTATNEVASKKQIAQLFLARATTVAKLKEAFDLGVSQIESVTVLNVPVWSVGGVVVTTGQTSDAPFQPPAGRSFVVRASQPSSSIDGPVSIEHVSHNGSDDDFTSENRVPGDDAKSHETVITLDSGFNGNITFNFRSRNICGPSEVWVELTTP